MRKTERDILLRLRTRIDPSCRMSLAELNRYAIRWVATRLDADIIWVDPNINGSTEWSPQELELIGKMPDAVLAHKIGRTFMAVKVRRHKLQIPRYRPPPGIPEEAVRSYNGIVNGFDFDYPRDETERILDERAEMNQGRQL